MTVDQITIAARGLCELNNIDFDMLAEPERTFALVKGRDVLALLGEAMVEKIFR